MDNIKEQLEEVIKKNLPEKKEFTRKHTISNRWERTLVMEYNQAISQIDTSLIADEVLKVVVEKIIKENYWNLLDQEEFNRRLRNLLTNSSTLEGEQSEHLSTNKENKDNE